MKFWRTFLVVLWSFLGIRKHSEWQKDKQNVSILGILLVGIVCTIIFVVGLMFLVYQLVPTTHG
ncbi:MAG: DUF2970 domain-containing protein [Gammaproteobacteria bacterium]|nr:DUF2970 domain-containing protein [Gammaproteobacteria bacterium]